MSLISDERVEELLEKEKQWDRLLDIIAEWANEEGISFDATARLQEMLDGKAGA